MLIGYNNDVQYRGKVFHIQTEDRGSSSMQIETQIFHAGAILDTRIVSYEELVAGESDQETRNRNIKLLMQKTHKELYKNLFSGGYDHYVGLEPVEKRDAAEVEEDFTPSQERIPDAARALEESGEIADELKAATGGDHIDLQSLKSRLAKMSSAASDASDSSEVNLAPASTATTAKPADAAGSGVLKPVLSLSKKPQRVNKPGSSAPTKNVSPSQDSVDSWAQTGVQAWQGCEPSSSELSILQLVESLL